MLWRCGTSASTRSHRPARLASFGLPVCGALLLLAGAGVPAPAQEFPPAYLPPDAETGRPRAATAYYYQTSWHRQALAGQPPAALTPAAVRGAPPAPDEGSLIVGPAAQATIVQCSAVEAPGGADDVLPSFLIQVQLRRAEPGADLEEGAVPSFLIQLEPPGPERLFRVESESAFQERVRQSTPRRPFEPVLFPDEPVLSKSKEPPQRAWPPQPCRVEPTYVCYGPLFFQQKYFERYGWDLGVLSPFVSLMTFWYDGITFPYHLTTVPYCGSECNAGYCLPGDPTPLRLDPPHWPLTFEWNTYRIAPRAEGCATR